MTIREWLKGLTEKNTSDEGDAAKMQNLLHRYGFPTAIVTCGIVYLEGKGTMEAPPASIHSLAGILLAKAS